MATGFDRLRTQLSAFVGNGTRVTPLTGGDTCSACLLEDGGNRFFLKTSDGKSRLFECEAHSLMTLEKTRTVRTPHIVDFGESHLLLEYIAPGAVKAGYWMRLAQELAMLHSTHQQAFGFDQDNFCGRGPHPNPPCPDGHVFFSEYRLLYQGRLARDDGLLERQHIDQLESLCHHLPDLIPEQTPALLHGDLWSGNHFAASDGLPVLVDPASYYGWPETDLAMMSLFGNPPPTFYAAYRELRNLEGGLEQRFPVYNLYHLLNHLNLFGLAYLAGVEEVLARYS